MKRKHIFITSLTMWIGTSVLILLSYCSFLWALWYDDGSVPMSLWFMSSFFLVVLPTIIPFTNAKRWFTVVIMDKNGITQKLFGIITIRSIEWNEILEIRLSTYMGCWVFFSKRPLSGIFYDNIVKRKDVIQIGFSKKLINAIKEYTEKEIIGY